ncbi:hypothetical protein ACA910_020109 [Epithemia clementina (nom. ined.)]
MHKAELILKHATGIAVHKRGGVIVDNNPSFMSVFKKVHTFASWLMSVRARSRFTKLRDATKQRGQKVTEITLPNATRVAGTNVLFQALLLLWTITSQGLLEGTMSSRDNTPNKNYGTNLQSLKRS